MKKNRYYKTVKVERATRAKQNRNKIDNAWKIKKKP